MRNKAFETFHQNGCCMEGESCEAKFEFQTSIVGAQNMEYDAHRLKKLGLASNCYAEDNDFNHATHKATAVCHPMYDMTKLSTGERVRDTTMTVTAYLGVCDITDEVMPQVMADLRKVAADNLIEKGYALDRDADLACKTSVLPSL